MKILFTMVVTDSILKLFLDKSLQRTLLLMIVLNVLFPVEIHALSWGASQVVDSDNDVGFWTSIAIDPFSGYPCISYYSENSGADEGDYRFARWNGGSWDIETIEAFDYHNSQTSNHALRFNSLSNPCAIYCTYNSGTFEGELKYAEYNGSSWDIEEIDTVSARIYSPSFDLDSSWNPHISYCVADTRDVKYARWDGSSWQVQTLVSTDRVGIENEIVIDSADNIYVCYFWIKEDLSEVGLHYVKWNGSSWSAPMTIDSEPYVYGQLSMIIDGSDNPRVAYNAVDLGGNGQLRHAHYNGASWNTETILTEPGGIIPYGPGTPSLFLVGGESFITFDDCMVGGPPDVDLRYVLWTGSSWDIGEANPGIDGGEGSSAVVESDSLISISYKEWGNGNLMYIKQLPDPTSTATITPTQTITPTLTASATLTISSTVTPTVPSVTPTRTVTPTFTFTMTPELEEIVVYPNPFNPDKAVGGTLKFKGLPYGARVEIYTVSGELVIELREENGMAFWDGRNKNGTIVSMGSYAYVVKKDKKTRKRGKVVVQR